MPRASLIAGLLLIAAPAAFAQVPNAAPLQGMKQARTYVVENHSGQTIVSAHAYMRDKQQMDLLSGHQLPYQEGRNIVVKPNACLAELTVKLKSGKVLQANGPGDCRQTRITVNANAIQIGDEASNRPPTSD